MSNMWQTLHGKEEQVWADSGFRGAPRRVDRTICSGQASVRTDEGALPWLAKNTAKVVTLSAPLDGAKEIDGDDGSGVSEISVRPEKSA